MTAPERVDYRRVADLYREVIGADNYKPAVRVAERLGIPVRTAHGRISRARQMGLLESIESLRLPTRDDLEAEIQRLRSAFREIVNVLGPERTCGCHAGDCGLDVEAVEALRIAWAALAGEPS